MKPTPAKTVTQRVADLRARRAAEGLLEVRGLWLPLALHARVKAYAAKLLKKTGASQ